MNVFAKLERSLPWIISPVGAHVGTAMKRAMEYEELCMRIAMLSGATVDEVRERVRSDAYLSTGAALVDTAAMLEIDVMMGRATIGVEEGKRMKPVYVYRQGGLSEAFYRCDADEADAILIALDDIDRTVLGTYQLKASRRSVDDSWEYEWVLTDG